MSTDKERSRDIKVGLFVALGVALLTAVLFLIGQERRFFEQPVYLRALFPNVSGLKVGAPVRLAGVDVGIVSAIEFPDVDPGAELKLVASTDANVLAPDTTLQLLHDAPFEAPMNVAITATDPRDELELRLRVSGEDQFGAAEVTEDLRVRVHGGRSIVTGTRFFRKVAKIEVVSVRGNEPGTAISIGVGRLKKITVVMRVSAEVLTRIRHDSEARVDSMGLLGDKTIDLSLGSQEFPPHKDGDIIRSATTLDLNAAMADAQRILENVVVGTDQLRKVLAGFSAAGGEEALVAAVRSIQDIAEEIQNGQGLLHQIVFDPKTGAQYKDIVADVAASTKKVDESLAEVKSLLDEVRTGEGLVHAVIYGKEGEKAVTQAREALAQATQILEDVRTKRGVVHNLIYDEDRGEFVGNLNAASDDIKKASTDVRQAVSDVRGMIDEVKQGKGTLGALIKDPTVYEDLKILLGNARRNDAVRALVRYSIAAEDKKSEAPPRPADK